jgi:hypothetical protein
MTIATTKRITLAEYLTYDDGTVISCGSSESIYNSGGLSGKT